MVHLASADFYANLPQRTPVAVRMAQSVMFVSYLGTAFPAVLDGVLAQIRAASGAGMTNDAIVNYILAQTGKTLAELDSLYQAYALTF